MPSQLLLRKGWHMFRGFVSDKADKYKVLLLGPELSDSQFLLSLTDHYTDLNDFLKQFKARKEASFFIAGEQRRALRTLIQEHFPNFARQVVEEANKVYQHVFDLLGSGDVNLNEFINRNGGKERCGYLPWYFDFKTGHRWAPKKYYKEIEIPYGKADIKVPWELSRFQHATVLGQAYWLTGDEKYAREFACQVDDWIDRNPPKFGVNWACTMDVAIRVANWVWGYYFFKDSEALTNEFMVKLLKSLLAHGRHIMWNLENNWIMSNHYLSDLVGLAYLGIAFPEFEEAKQWREFGIQELVKEMDKQVYDDGMDFEASTCYHRLVLELFFYPALLCKLNDIKLPNDFIEKLKKMFDFVLYVLKPNGRMPPIGDNDNGRLHVLGKRDILDMTYLLTFATLFFDDPKYKIEEFGFAPEALWLFGPEDYERWKKMPGRTVEELESKAFSDGGIYVMRHKKDYMVISCGPNGQNGNGGHAHNDKLSFELCVDGEDIIVDPGTYVYTADPAWRNRFRSTAYHNTVMVDGEEQNRFSAASLFEMEDDAKACCTCWESNGEYDLFIGEHLAYMRLNTPIVHRRRIRFDKKVLQWTIADSLRVASQDKDLSIHTLDWVLNLATNLDVDFRKLTSGDTNVLLIGKDSCLNIFLTPAGLAKSDFQITESWFSPNYGSKQATKVLAWGGTFNNSLDLTFRLVKDKKC